MSAPASKPPSPPLDPRKNPSYPQREHIHERAHWLGFLSECEQRITEARRHLDSPGNSTSLQRAAYERLFAQMLGARDQIAEAARRLPMETGDLYDEDKHRLEEAVSALDRVAAQWKSLESTTGRPFRADPPAAS